VTQNQSPNGAAPPRLMRRIGLWGAPGSGKTSFLAALNVAVTQSRSDWTLYGVNDESVDFLTESTETLTDKRRFPEATTDLTDLSWVMVTEIERQVRTGRLFQKPQKIRVPLEFHLDLLDAPGDMFKSKPSGAGGAADFDELFDGEDDGPEAAPADEDRLIETLAACDGIVYLFDPIRERDKGDAYQYFQRTLAQLGKRALEGRRLVGAKLPQHLAVCITKFDEPKVFRTADRRGYVTYDPADEHMFPRVHEENAEELFEDLCKVSRTGTAALVHGSIRKSFHRDRVRYFASSSVGFYLGQSVRFRPADYQNVVPDGNGGYRIRGDIHPVNVLEPLLWLGQQITGSLEY
jgi:energy-coupling factor transporter ATP-binding protein EcfA2